MDMRANRDCTYRESATFLVRENCNLMISRVRHLERYGVATELEPGRWALSGRAEQVLKDPDHRNEAIHSIDRALTRNGLAEERTNCEKLPRAWPLTSSLVDPSLIVAMGSALAATFLAHPIG
jgi:hypothetical protein